MPAVQHRLVRARRHLYIIARTDAVASEGMDGAVARAKAYLQAGADAVFPEALISAEMFREFARRLPNVPLCCGRSRRSGRYWRCSEDWRYC